MNSSVRRICLFVATVVLVASCQRPEPDGASSATAAPVTDSTVETTAPTTTPDSTAPSTSTTVASTVPATSAPETSAPATTSPATTAPATAPATTEAPDPESSDDLILAFDGIRPLAFGDADTAVLSTLASVLGDPISDDSTEYATPEDGRFVNESLEEAFVSPFGRTVCFANRLCAQFGAGSATALQFIGWEFAGDEAAGLATEDGITVGSLWSDHEDAIIADEGGCFSVGFGAADGVDIILQSGGEPFVTVTDDGGFEAGSPDPDDVTIIALSAGDLPIQLFADC